MPGFPATTISTGEATFSPGSWNSQFHQIETRDALINYFLDQKEISPQSLTAAARTSPAPRFRSVA